jgi:hypothetical protein
MDLCTDISFEIGGKLVVLIEHQSTINENMPLRLLLYICEIYKRLVPQKMLYREKLQPIPSPEFYVIYNGKEKYGDRIVLRLSDAFFLAQKTPCLELEVPVININKGHNEKLLQRSVALSDYSMFVSLVNEFESNLGSFDAAVDDAIKYCRECGIMGAYLENSKEVRRLLITEWNDDEYREVMREEGREEGLLEGREKGREEGLLEVAHNMKANGLEIEIIAGYTGLSKEIISEL